MVDDHSRFTRENWTARQVALIAVANLDAAGIPATQRNLSQWCSDEELEIADSTVFRAAEALTDDEGGEIPRLAVENEYRPKQYSLTEYGKRTLARQAELCPDCDAI